MINKVISALMKYLLLLEIRLRGARIKNSAWRMKISQNKYLHGHYIIFPPYGFNLLFNDEKKIVYLNMAKSSGRTIMDTLYQSESMRADFDQMNEQRLRDGLSRIAPTGVLFKNASISFPMNIKGVRHNSESWTLFEWDQKNGSRRTNISLEHYSSYFIFTFVRNPFSRLVSFFQSKYWPLGGAYHVKHKQFFWIDKVSNFDDLARKISKLPDFHLDLHGSPQHIFIEELEASVGEIDFIGKYETLQQDFEKIRSQFDLLPLRHIGQSTGEKENWRDYYTPKTAKMVYQKYRKDFEMFGYEDEYPKLLDHLNNKAQMRTPS